MNALTRTAYEPPPAAADPSNVFQIFRNQIGRWHARRADGMVLGIFFKRDAAIRFARDESDDAASLRLVVEGEDGCRRN